MTAYWPWWAGALGLALVTLVHTFLGGRSMGLSSSWDRVVHWRAERAQERADAAFGDEQALVAALVAATPEELRGPSTDTQPLGTPGAPGSPTPSAPLPAATRPRGPRHTLSRPVASRPVAGSTVPRRPAPLLSQAVLLTAVLVGGWIAAATSGHFAVRLDMGEAYARLVTANPLTMVAVLFVGGVLVGFGTRLAGGCSSGHGLGGCGRLQPVSLVATATFFAAAVATSFLLWKVI